LFFERILFLFAKGRKAKFLEALKYKFGTGFKHPGTFTSALDLGFGDGRSNQAAGIG